MIATFGDFSLDVRTHQLRRGGRPVRLQALPARLLATLIHAEGGLVRHDELCSILWPDRIVAFDRSLHTAVKQLRCALGDNARMPSYVATDVGRGYRLLIDVRWTERAADHANSSPRWLSPAAAAVIAATALVSTWRENGPMVPIPSAPCKLSEPIAAPQPVAERPAVLDHDFRAKPRGRYIPRKAGEAERPTTSSNMPSAKSEKLPLPGNWDAQRVEWARERQQWTESRREWAAERPSARDNGG